MNTRKRAQSHQIRLIGGQWKRTRLPVPDRPGLRPTPDRVRETLFNWLASRAGAGGGLLPAWRCLDAFAGTGALGLEAASRGAAAVLLVESDAALAAQLQRHVERLGAVASVRVQRGDGVAALQSAAPASLDAVFIDPPFDRHTLHGAALAAAARALAPAGVIYLEAPRRWPPEELAALGLSELRYLKAGAVHAQLLSALATGPGPA